MENQVTSLVDALPDIVWTALPDGNVDFSINPGSTTPALAVTMRMAKVGRLPSTRRI